MTMMTRNNNEMTMMTRNNNEKTTRNLQEQQQQYSRTITEEIKVSMQSVAKVHNILQKSATCHKIFAIYLQASGWDGGHVLLQTLLSKAQHFNF